METQIFTLWTIAHVITGVSFGLIFSMRFKKVFEFIIFIPILIFILENNITMRVISIVIILMCLLGITLKYLEKRKIKLKPVYVFIAVAIFLISWEMFEYFTSSFINLGDELLKNRISDMIVGFAGFVLSYLFLKRKKSQ